MHYPNYTIIVCRCECDQSLFRFRTLISVYYIICSHLKSIPFFIHSLNQSIYDYIYIYIYRYEQLHKRVLLFFRILRP